MRYGVNAWVGLRPPASLLARRSARVIGALTFRSGCAARTSRWSRSPLPRFCASSPASRRSPAPASALLIKLDLHTAAFQFQSRAVFYWVILALVAIVARRSRGWIEQSRFGAWLMAVRENEDAARRSASMPRTSSSARWRSPAAITAAAGCFYVQYFLFVDSGIAYGTVDLGRGAAGADHRRRRHRVRAAARRAGGAGARRGQRSSSPAVRPGST